ncbi:RICIN domain-containing protein [Plantactinospora endophytica]|uniref:Ricin B lectin domain-containing protein n=1 Tax=Plantactinospora endophytica TaxID=673535 RepID=A0ABQ4DXC0_9ACTN|nr:RICIN domain-containing protein [Plantactinospora endophytica]GIG87104.1 hypothetical protein Pen02_20400 [Plantactinospora endophytica]
MSSPHPDAGPVRLVRRFGRAVAATILAVGLASASTATAHATPEPASPAPARPAAWTGEEPLRLTDLSQLPRLDAARPGPGTKASYLFQYVRNRYRGQCLDGDRHTIPADGSKVQLWACNRWTNQAWILTTVNGYPAGYYWIQNYHRGQCLGGDRNTIPADGAKVQLWACNGWTNQIWMWNGAQFRNYYGRQCLDGDRATIPADGSKVRLWACNGWTNQNWSLRN